VTPETYTLTYEGDPPVEIPVRRVSRVKDADGFLCLTCGLVRDDCSPAPWGWNKSRHLHASGSPTHQTILFSRELEN
jgi:hypothetical protein